MPKFRYRMQNILDIKSKLEEQARNEYAQTQVRLNQENEKKQQLQTRLAEYETQAQQLRQEKLDIRAMAENQNAVDVVTDYIKNQEKVILKVTKELDLKRDKLNKAIQERKMHEKLKEKALDAYLEEEKSNEMKTVDELTSYVYGKKNTQ